MPRARFTETLRLLVDHDVEFVVGMTAGILHGAPVTTVDLDVVHRRSPQNVGRLLRVLGELGAVYRHDPRQLRPAESHLVGPGHQLLSTTHGDLDCLGTIDQDRGYQELLGQTVEIQGTNIHVASPRLDASASTVALPSSTPRHSMRRSRRSPQIDRPSRVRLG